jgi:hypothetical protein
LSVCWIGRHLNNTDEGFKLFSEWSRKVKGYENEPKEILKVIFINKINMIKILMNYQYYTTQEN